jgi:KaiC/GvpD/RAD55 family RecA-like ATPase
MTETLETGIEVLDRKLDGGIPAGRVVALSASPVSQSELFLYEMAATRPTIYLTTERTVDDVEGFLEQTGTDVDGIDVRRISAEAPLAEARSAIDELADGSTFIIDPIRLLESTGSEQYRTFFNDMKARITEADGLALLHCLEGRDVPGQRDRTEYLADIIFSLSTEIRGGTLQNDLAIPKFRGGKALPESIDLDLTADVTIDVSRKIA